MIVAANSSWKQNNVISNYGLHDPHMSVMLHTIAKWINKLTNAVMFVWTKLELVSKVIRRHLCWFDVELANVIKCKVRKNGFQCRGDHFFTQVLCKAKRGLFWFLACRWPCEILSVQSKPGGIGDRKNSIDFIGLVN